MSKEESTPVRTLTREQVQALSRACRRGRTHSTDDRDRAMLALLLYTGLRPPELVALTVDQVILDEPDVMRWSGMRPGRPRRASWLTVDTRRFPLDGWPHLTLAGHLATRGEVSSKAHPRCANLLFLSEAGEPLTPGAVRSMLTRLGRRVEADFPGTLSGVPVTVETCRATYAIRFLMDQGTPSALAALMSNLAPTTLESYQREARQRLERLRR